MERVKREYLRNCLVELKEGVRAGMSLGEMKDLREARRFL